MALLTLCHHIIVKNINTPPLNDLTDDKIQWYSQEQLPLLSTLSSTNWRVFCLTTLPRQTVHLKQVCFTRSKYNVVLGSSLSILGFEATTLCIIIPPGVAPQHIVTPWKDVQIVGCGILPSTAVHIVPRREPRNEQVGTGAPHQQGNPEQVCDKFSLNNTASRSPTETNRKPPLHASNDDDSVIMEDDAFSFLDDVVPDDNEYLDGSQDNINLGLAAAESAHGDPKEEPMMGGSLAKRGLTSNASQPIQPHLDLPGKDNSGMVGKDGLDQVEQNTLSRQDEVIHQTPRIEAAEIPGIKPDDSSTDRNRKKIKPVPKIPPTHSVRRSQDIGSSLSVLQQLQQNGEQHFIGQHVPVPSHEDSDIECLDGPDFEHTRYQNALRSQLQSDFLQMG